MKRILITMGIILMSVLGYSQATNVADFRITNAITAFGVNLPIGTKVYNIDTEEYWVATAGVANNLTLTTGSASFTLVGKQVIDVLNLNGTDLEISLSNDGVATETLDLSSLQDGTGTDDQTIDVSNLTGTVLHLSLENDGEADIEIELSSLQDGTGTDNQTASEVPVTATGFGGNLTTGATDVQTALQEINDLSLAGAPTTLDITTKTANTFDIESDGTDITLPASTTDDAGLMTASQYDKLDGIEALAEVNYTSFTQLFEEDDPTPTPHTLTYTATDLTGARVSVNGATLDPSLYTLSTTELTLDGPVYQWDQVIITYTHAE